MLADVGLLILRVVIGLVFMGHGAQKLFGWFGGHGLAGTSHFLGSLGLRPAYAWALVVGLAELAGGLMLALGLFGPTGPALILAVMLVAMVMVHRAKGFWNTNGGVEFPVVLGAVAVAIAFTGHGAYSLDRVLNLSLNSSQAIAVAFAISLLGAIISIAVPRLPATRQHRSPSAA